MDRLNFSIDNIDSYSTRSLLLRQREPLIEGHVSKRNFYASIYRDSTISMHRFIETYHTSDLIRFTRSILLCSSGASSIPSNIESVREDSILQDERVREINKYMQVVASLNIPILQLAPYLGLIIFNGLITHNRITISKDEMQEVMTSVLRLSRV